MLDVEFVFLDDPGVIPLLRGDSWLGVESVAIESFSVKNTLSLGFFHLGQSCLGFYFSYFFHSRNYTI